MIPRVTVVGLGPAGADLVTPAATAEIERHGPDRTILRTRRHPAAEVVSEASLACDDLYDTADTFADVYRAIVDRVVDHAETHGEVCYVVPGSPRVLERTVELLVADPRVDVVVQPATSFLDLVWARLGIDPFDATVTLVDGHRFAEAAAGRSGPFLVAHCHNRRVLSDIKLAADEGPDTPVVLLSRLGLPDEAAVETTWSELDRTVEPDHLTSLYIPALTAPVAAEFARFEQLMTDLRTGCPWDAEQTHHSLRRHLLEETYEVLEAIDRLAVDEDEGYEMLEEELGDLLFQVFFHSAIATEQGRFTAADVARGIHDKLRHRHPHVFGDVDVADADEVLSNWEQIKKAEKGDDSIMASIPGALPSVLYALKVQKKAASLGAQRPDIDADLDATVARLAAAMGTAPDDDERERLAGHALFAAVSVCRRLGVDAEAALRRSADTFRRRFMAVEQGRDHRDFVAQGDVVTTLWDGGDDR